MAKFLIGTLNNISPVGLANLTDKYELTDDIDKAAGIIVRSYKMHDMDFSDNLLCIGRAGAGVNNIPLEKCADQGIVVFNAPGANSNAVKELCVAALIMGARNVFEGSTWVNTLEGDVSSEIEAGKKQFAGTEISGKTLGIMGLGAIGAKLANAAYALGMNVVGYETFKPNACLTAPVELYDDLTEMVKVCDYVSIHVPSLPETKGMINKDLIANMKDGVIVLNFARPDLVVNADIIEACESGKIRKYLTDVPNEELTNRKNIVCTPHIGASSEEAEDNCATMAVQQAMDYIENGNIRNSVNLPNVQLDTVEGTKRISVIAKCPAETVDRAVMSAVGADNVVASKSNDMVAFKPSEYTAAIYAVKDTCDVNADDIKADGILKVRVL